MKAKKQLMIALLLLASIEGFGQYVALPDSNFGNWLYTNGYSSCVIGNGTTGYQLDTTCAAALPDTILDLSSSGYIQDITGIEYFTNLKQLNCTQNPLTSLPNLPAGLTSLFCWGIFSLTYIPSLPAGLVRLDCYSTGLASLPALPATLSYLDCHDVTQITSLPSLPSSLTYLNCGKCQLLASLPSLPPGLTYLNCNACYLSNLPNLPSSLTYLNCAGNYNNFTTLPSLPAGLDTLICGSSQLTTLPSLPSTLTFLSCDGNRLTSLPSLPASITYLDCSDNQLTALPNLPAGLTTIYCQINQLTALPALPPSLTYFDCNANQLTTLPALPAGLVFFYCNSNQLTVLPNLSSSLTSLDCSYNQLTVLPILPTGLSYLNCAHDSITNLPYLPDSLSVLYCNYNKLTNLPALPTVLIALYCNNNSSLYCLPPIFQNLLADFFIAGTAITCVPNRFSATNHDINPATMPICTGSCAIASAGPDQSICQNSTATMAATGTGTWAALASNPAAVTIDTPSSPTTTISGFTVAGVYSFTWAGDTMTVTVHANTMVLTDSAVVNVSCFGGNNGSACVSVTGGVPGYSFLWYPGGNTTACLSSPWMPAGVNTIIVTDGYGCISIDTIIITQPDSLQISFTTQNTSCAGGHDGGIIFTGSGGTPAYTYVWSPPGLGFGSTLTSLPAGQYCLTVTDNNGCTAAGCDSVGSGSAICPSDTVWPGDADANHLVDNNDLLPIGLGYDTTGPARTLAQQGIVWQADSATLWQDYFTSYSPTVNFNNADCNGDGIIDANDTLAILTNFGDTHAKTNNLPGPWRSGIPLLGLSYSTDTIYNNDTLTTNIFLGDSALPVNGIYGLAFTFNYDPLVVDSNYSRFYFIPSWMGDSTNSININRNFSTGQVKAAITGIDHAPRSGNGQLAVFRCIITTDNINGKDYSYYLNQQYISDITAIDQYGNRLSLNAGMDSNYVGWFVNGINPISKPAMINVYPNPAGDLVRITSGSGMTDIKIIDIIGNEVQTVRSDNKLSETVDISWLASGIYTVHVTSQGGASTAKLIVSR